MELLTSDIALVLLEKLRLFGIKLYDEDFLELSLRLALNLVVTYFIVLKIYSATRKDSEYLFTYLVFSPVVFFVCHLFASTKLSIGFAFGLFAVFSILRYRTTTIPVKEMTYMFIVISVAVINAISTKKISYAELMLTNIAILTITWYLEKHMFSSVTSSQVVYYEVIENIRPERMEALKSDLKERTGKDITRIEILEADYLKDAAKLLIYFKVEKNNG
jgi:hypothetical protein